MTYAFRKYLNKRGSALFMVLSLMTALMILVMAMYFSVVSSRDVQYKVFYQEQAYRSATSLSDAIVAGLKGNSWQTATGSSPLLSAFTNMSEGDTITTNGNDFKAFVLTGSKEEQDQLGAYTVTITRMADETINSEKTRVYDVAITTSSGGVLDTTHTFIHIQEPEGEAQEGRSNIFTSTGYVPNDVFLDGGEFYTDVFFDNENAIIGALNQMQNKIYGNVYAGGSLKLNYIDGTSGSKNEVSTWAIRNNFTHTASQGLNLGTSSERGLLLVGGDATFSGGLPSNVDIYVLGDAYFTSNQSMDNSTDVRLFVYGDIVLDGNAQWFRMPDVTYASGHVNNTGSSCSETFPKWKDNTSLPADVMSSHDMAMKLDSLTASNDYPKWDINDDAPAKDGYIPELDPDNAAYNPVTIKFNNDSDKDAAVPAKTYTQYLNWESGHTIADYYGEGQPLNYTACVIEDVVNADGTNTSANNLTLVIDTGDDPNNQYIIKVTKNRDFDADGTNESFSWYPYDAHSSSVEMAVLVRGKGSVVIDIPEGVVYQDMDNVLFMHETWFAILGGKIEQKGSNSNSVVYDGRGTVISGTAAANAVPFIHTCDDTCSTCNYKTEDGEKCEKCDDGTKVKVVTCEEHGGTTIYCPNCEANYEPEKKANGDYYGVCANRIEPSAVTTKVNSITASSPLWASTLKDGGDGTNWYMPNTNIFLVSCEESADIRLSNTVGGVTIMQNGFFGFIYAPYMTFKAYGNNAGGGYVRFCGGMIVSDYIIRDSMSFLTCYPDQLPESLMSEADRKTALQALASKSWKISLAGY